ncbi:MAG: glycosyltransferase [Candidatus Latescibacterota bacterium]
MNRLLRVLHIITRLDRGGSAENTLLTVAGLDPDSFDVTVAVGPTAGDPSPTEAKARNRSVRFVHIPDLVRAPRPLRDLRAILNLRRLIRSEAWDVVHTHTSKAGILGRWVAHRHGIPAIVHTPHGHVFYGYCGAATTAAFVRLERRAARWCHRLVALTAGTVMTTCVSEWEPPRSG